MGFFLPDDLADQEPLPPPPPRPPVVPPYARSGATAVMPQGSVPQGPPPFSPFGDSGDDSFGAPAPQSSNPYLLAGNGSSDDSLPPDSGIGAPPGGWWPQRQPVPIGLLSGYPYPGRPGGDSGDDTLLTSAGGYPATQPLPPPPEQADPFANALVRQSPSDYAAGLAGIPFDPWAASGARDPGIGPLRAGMLLSPFTQGLPAAIGENGLGILRPLGLGLAGQQTADRLLPDDTNPLLRFGVDTAAALATPWALGGAGAAFRGLNDYDLAGQVRPQAPSAFEFGRYPGEDRLSRSGNVNDLTLGNRTILTPAGEAAVRRPQPWETAGGIAGGAEGNWYIHDGNYARAGGNKVIGPFASEQEALSYDGFQHDIAANRREVVSQYSEDDLAYLRSGDGEPKPPRFMAPSKATMAKVQRFLSYEAPPRAGGADWTPEAVDALKAKIKAEGMTPENQQAFNEASAQVFANTEPEPPSPAKPMPQVENYLRASRMQQALNAAREEAGLPPQDYGIGGSLKRIAGGAEGPQDEPSLFDWIDENDPANQEAAGRKNFPGRPRAGPPNPASGPPPMGGPTGRSLGDRAADVAQQQAQAARDEAQALAARRSHIPGAPGAGPPNPASGPPSMGGSVGRSDGNRAQEIADWQAADAREQTALARRLAAQRADYPQPPAAGPPNPPTKSEVRGSGKAPPRGRIPASPEPPPAQPNGWQQFIKDVPGNVSSTIRASNTVFDLAAFGRLLFTAGWTDIPTYMGAWEKTALATAGPNRAGVMAAANRALDQKAATSGVLPDSATIWKALGRRENPDVNQGWIRKLPGVGERANVLATFYEIYRPQMVQEELANRYQAGLGTRNAIHSLGDRASFTKPLTAAQLQDPKVIADVARGVNLVSGQASVRPFGQSSSILIEFPNWLAAQGELIVRAFIDGSITGQMARRALTRNIGIGLAATTAVNMAQGYAPNDPRVWRNGVPMAMLPGTDGGSLDLFGPLGELAARTTGIGRRTYEGARDETDGGAAGAAAGLGGGLYDFYRGVAGPLVGAGIDLGTGVDPLGRAIDNKGLYALRRVAPFNTPDVGAGSSALWAQGARALGGRVHEPSTLTQLNEKLAADPRFADLFTNPETGLRDPGYDNASLSAFSALGPREHRDLAKDPQYADYHPLLADLDREQQQRAAAGDQSAQAFAARADSDKRRLSEEDKAAQGFLAAVGAQDPNAAKNFRAQLGDINFTAAREREQVDRDYQQVKAGDKTMPTDPNKAALYQYYQLLDKNRLPGGRLDGQGFDQSLGALQQTWNDKQAAYVQRETGITEHDNPVVKQYYDDSKIIRDSGYFDLRKQSLQALEREFGVPQATTDTQLQGILTKLYDPQTAQRLVSRMVSLVDNQMQQWRLDPAHAAVAPLIRKWGFGGSGLRETAIAGATP